MTTTTETPRLTSTPTERMLTAGLVIAPIGYLAADSTYAALGWDSPAGAVLHILSAIAYGFVILRVAAWLPERSVLAAVLIAVGLIGLAGNVAYGFETIHVSLGDTALVDQTGVASIIKPLGLFFPASLVLAAIALWRLGRRWQAIVVAAAGLVWPVGHIANIAPVAVAVNVALVLALGSLLWQRPARPADAA